MRNCTRDEGRSFEAGSQVLASNRCKLLSSKAIVVSVAVSVGGDIPAGEVERGERKRTADELSKADLFYESGEVKFLSATRSF